MSSLHHTQHHWQTALRLRGFFCLSLRILLLPLLSENRWKSLKNHSIIKAKERGVTLGTIASGTTPIVEDRAIKAQAFPTAVGDLTKLVQATLENSKAEDVTIINLHGKSDMADFMIIASGRSERHVASIAQHLHDAIKASGSGFLNMEGHETGHWVLVDAGDIIVHIFKPDVREYYNLEKMWNVALPEEALALS